MICALYFFAIQNIGDREWCRTRFAGIVHAWDVYSVVMNSAPTVFGLVLLAGLGTTREPDHCPTLK